MSSRNPFLRAVRLTLLIGTAISTPMFARAETPAPVISQQDYSHIAPYLPRFGRARPVIAIVGENSGTELTDFFIPYGVLTRSGAAEVMTLATQAGPLKMMPALTIQPDATVAEFDRKYPQGADYVIVPAVVKSSDPTLVAWVASQGAKGATVVSICDGAFVVANSGLMKGRHATAHWASQGFRRKTHPEVNWVKNIRYVVDGQVVSSAGISASLPTALALVEAIAGRDAASREAKDLGVTDWSTRHNSEAFEPRLGVNLLPLIAVNYTNTWFRSRDGVGVPVSDGVDEIALGFTADAWSRTGLSHAYAVSADAQPVTSRHGLIILPEPVAGGAPLDQTLPPLGDDNAAQTLDKALAAIAKRYGRSNAYGVALDLEYPGFHK